MFVWGSIEVYMPVTSLAIYPKDTPPTFDQRKVSPIRNSSGALFLTGLNDLPTIRLQKRLPTFSQSRDR